jgi:DNA invertase Pin-like site-specific DNA recombinase
MVKAYGYLRVSGTGQVDGDGFDRQRELISRFADQAEIVIPRFYEERGISGAKGEKDRPAFQEMLTAILSNGVRAVVVERLDRLAREYVVQEQLLVYLAAKGITLWNASTGENVTEAVKADPMKKAVIQIQGVFAELEKSLLVNWLAKAKERKRAENANARARRAGMILRSSGSSWPGSTPKECRRRSRAFYCAGGLSSEQLPFFRETIHPDFSGAMSISPSSQTGTP